MASFARFASPRLRRRLAALETVARKRVKQRLDLREKARAEASIAAALARLRENGAAIEPGEGGGLRYWRGARGRLAETDTPELCEADAAFIARDPELAAREAKRAADLAAWAARYVKGGPPPDPGAAPFAWYAWSVAQGVEVIDAALGSGAG